MHALTQPMRQRFTGHPSRKAKKGVSSYSMAIAGLTGILLIFLVLLGGCSNPVKVPEQITEPGALDQPPESLASLQPQYVIQSGDMLDVKFYYSNHLNETITVRPDGRISLQLIHDVPAATLTANELTDVLKNKYSAYLKNPEISVIIRSFSSQRVYVDGEVQQPGLVKMDGYMTILQAISSAGGLKDSGLSDEVLVIRRNSLKKPFVLTVNVEDARNGTDIAQDIRVEPHDIIYVPKSAIANVNTWMDLYIRKNIPFDLSFGFFKNID